MILEKRKKEKKRKGNVNMSLYIGMYLSVCILFGDKYVFTATVTFTTYVPIERLGLCRLY